MKRESLDTNEKRPEAMSNYLSYYGWHFNKKMFEFAVKHMKKDGKKLLSLSKEKVDEMLQRFNIELDNDMLYDAAYVANMGKADFYGSAIADELHLARFVKDYVDDEDGYDGIVFSRFYIDTIKKGIPIDWDEML